MSNDPFWAVIKAQLNELESATSADTVVKILSAERDPYHTEEGDTKRNLGSNGFFAGSGGDDTVYDALRTAGWRVIWSEASYYYAMKAPDGSAITYCEGDIYPRDTRRDLDAHNTSAR